MATKKVVYQFEAKVEQMQRELQTINAELRKVQKNQKKADDEVQKGNNLMTNSFKKLGGVIAATFAAEKVVAFAKQAIDAASDLNETISKTEQVFGDSAAGILKWSETSATALGLSQEAALNAASTFATFGKSAGLAGDDLNSFSQEMVELSGDFASFFNTSPEDAIQAIGAALRGESEPIRRYGILLNDATLKQRALEMGIISTTKGALTPQVKVLAAQAEILAQSADAQGDFARTSEGMANQSRIATAQFKNLTAELGQGLLPIATKTLGIVNEMLVGINAALLGFDKTRLKAREAAATESVQAVLELYKEQGDVILRLSQREVDMQKKRLETGIMNIDQLELEKEVFGEVRSEAIKMTATQRALTLKRLNQAQAEIELIEEYKRAQQNSYDVQIQGNEDTIEGIELKIKALKEEAKTTNINSEAYRELILEIERLEAKLKAALNIKPRIDEEALRTFMDQTVALADAAIPEGAQPEFGPTPEQIEQARQMYIELGMTEEEYANYRISLIEKQASALVAAGALTKEQYDKIILMQKQLANNSQETFAQVAGGVAEGFTAVTGAITQLFADTSQASVTFAAFQQGISLIAIIAQSAEAVSYAISGVWKDPTIPTVAGKIAAVGVSIATVLTNIAKAKAILNSNKTPQAPQFEQGGMVDGNLHSQGGTIIEAERGEYVVNRKMTAKYKDAITAINKGYFDEYVVKHYIAPLQGALQQPQQSFADNIAEVLMQKQASYLRKMSKGVTVNNINDLAKAMQGANINRFKA